MQTLGSIAAEKNSTIIFPVPIDFITNFAFSGGGGGGGPRQQQQQQQQQPMQQQQQQQQHCPHPVQYQVASEAQGPEKKVKHFQKSGLNRIPPTCFFVNFPERAQREQEALLFVAAAAAATTTTTTTTLRAATATATSSPSVAPQGEANLKRKKDERGRKTHGGKRKKV